MSRNYFRLNPTLKAKECTLCLIYTQSHRKIPSPNLLQQTDRDWPTSRKHGPIATRLSRSTVTSRAVRVMEISTGLVWPNLWTSLARRQVSAPSHVDNRIFVITRLQTKKLPVSDRILKGFSKFIQKTIFYHLEKPFTVYFELVYPEVTPDKVKHYVNELQEM